MTGEDGRHGEAVNRFGVIWARYWPVLPFAVGLALHMTDLYYAGLLLDPGVLATFEHLLTRPSGWVAIVLFLPFFFKYLHDPYP